MNRQARLSRMMQRYFALGIIVFSFVFSAFIAPAPAAAQLESAKDLLNTSGKAALGEEYQDEGNLPQTIGNIVKIILSLLGLLFVLMAIYAGFLWFTSGGNEDQIGKAKDILKNAIIGLIIVISAYSITLFVLRNAGEATGTTFEGVTTD